MQTTVRGNMSYFINRWTVTPKVVACDGLGSLTWWQKFRVRSRIRAVNSVHELELGLQDILRWV